MIKLTREAIALDPSADCRRNWVLKVTASSISDAEYEKYKEENDEDYWRDLRTVADYEADKRKESLKLASSLFKAAHGVLDDEQETEEEPEEVEEPVENEPAGEEPDEDVNIFVYHACVDGDPYHGDLFSNVASIQDMQSLPVGAPVGVDSDPNHNYVPFYRTDSVELYFHNLDVAERAWRIIKHDTAMLAREYYKARNLKKAEEEVF